MNMGIFVDTSGQGKGKLHVGLDWTDDEKWMCALFFRLS
jgi:hypothetical protein